MSSGIYATHPSGTGRTDGLRDILRSQDKLKSQQSLGLKRKPQKKSKQKETYGAAPPGYVFMPLGTPELADFCKKLSTQQGWPIHVVNAKPTSKVVLDKTKISHHVQRIGYHFKDSIVEEACSYLHYMISGGKFISEEELKQSSFVAKVMAKHGLSATTIAKQESPEQVKAAIRELFPKIPDSDLDEVVKHAWDQKSGRVGTVQGMDLSRRIQLAVTARIRHRYTDYDVLLKSFDWHTCRREVEPVCLKKLLEWRGEAGDDSLEEIVAETMLLDEQSDVNRPRPQRKSRTSGYETGDASDASVELSHRVAGDHDLRPESPSERTYGYVNGRVAAVQSYAYRHEVARAKIQAVRAQMALQPPVPARPVEQIERIHVQTDNTGKAPAQIVVGGKVLRRASPEPQQQVQPIYPRPQQPVYAQQPPQHSQPVQYLPQPHQQAVQYQSQSQQYGQPAQYQPQPLQQYSQTPQYAPPAQVSQQPPQSFQQPPQYVQQSQQQYLQPSHIAPAQYASQPQPLPPQYVPVQYQPIHGAPARVQQAVPPAQSIPQPQQWPQQQYQAQQAPYGQYPHR